MFIVYFIDIIIHLVDIFNFTSIVFRSQNEKNSEF